MAEFERLPYYGFLQKEWLPYAVAEDTVVLDWREWASKWGYEWRLLDCEGPCLIFEDMAPVCLKLAAAPVEVFGDDRQEA